MVVLSYRGNLGLHSNKQRVQKDFVHLTKVIHCKSKVVFQKTLAISQAIESSLKTMQNNLNRIKSKNYAKQFKIKT